MTIRSALWVIEQKILAEASKPKGVTFQELMDRSDMPKSTSRDHCRRLLSVGKLHCVRVKHGSGLRWFASGDHAKAFKAGQANCKARSNDAYKAQGVQIGLGQAVDLRFHVPDSHRGEFEALGVGRYLAVT